MPDTTPRRFIATVEIPRPPSLNEISGIHHAAARRGWSAKWAVNKETKAKAAYKRDAGWLVKKALRKTESRLPLDERVFVYITIFGRWRSLDNGPDRGNWEKWIGDALTGVLIHNDSPRYWEWEVEFQRGKPKAVLTIYGLGHPIVPAERSTDAKSRHLAR